MDTTGSIHALLNSCELKLRDIEYQYQQSLHTQVIDTSLQISIKNFLENLRSALDYLANRIWKKYEGILASKKPRVYFPIYSNSEKFAEHMQRTFPHLSACEPLLYSKLESVQPYSGPENEWLEDFATLCNENKHQELTPQIADTMTSLGGGADVVNGTSVIVFGEGNVVKGIPVEPGVLSKDSTPPNLDPRLSVTRWTEFKFQIVEGRSALEFLQECLGGARSIVSDLSPFL